MALCRQARRDLVLEASYSTVTPETAVQQYVVAQNMGFKHTYSCLSDIPTKPEINTYTNLRNRLLAQTFHVEQSIPALPLEAYCPFTSGEATSSLSRKILVSDSSRSRRIIYALNLSNSQEMPAQSHWHMLRPATCTAETETQITDRYRYKYRYTCLTHKYAYRDTWYRGKTYKDRNRYQIKIHVHYTAIHISTDTDTNKQTLYKYTHTHRYRHIHTSIHWPRQTQRMYVYIVNIICITHTFTYSGYICIRIVFWDTYMFCICIHNEIHYICVVACCSDCKQS